MERHEVLRVMLSAGRNNSVAVTDLRGLLLKLIVLSVKYVSRRQLWTTRFGEDYVDWDMVENLSGKNILGGCVEWLGLLGFCRWDDLGKQEGGELQKHPALLGLRRHMKDCSLDTGDGAAWTLVCKMFLLTLIQGLSSMHALEVLTCEVFKRNTQAGCTSLLAKQVRSVFSLPVFSFARADILQARRSTCSRPISTRRRCCSCWNGARWTPGRWSRRRPSCRPRWTTAS